MRYNMSPHGREEPLMVPRWFITTPVWVSLMVLLISAIILISAALEWDNPVLVVIGVFVLAFGALIVLVMRRAYYRPPRQS